MGGAASHNCGDVHGDEASWRLIDHLPKRHGGQYDGGIVQNN